MRRLTKDDIGEVNDHHIYFVLNIDGSKSIIIKALNQNKESGWVSVLLENPIFGVTNDIISTWCPTLQKRIDMSVYDNTVFNVFEFDNIHELVFHWDDLLWLPSSL